MDKFTIEFYERENGTIPAEEFLLSLNVKMRAKLVGIMKILQEKGNLLREPYSKHLEEGIFELRGKVGNDISRVLYFFYHDGKIIVLSGFLKKTQKTPRSEIIRAKRYRNDYLERYGNHEKI
ncbi:MAG: type II toxin-antitoxin system RelE/ParE family toxin [Lachnospiraceae bacterium]|nr:type II toxin-antitoxin system RelE/ParE family toxin [Lachnospiraceae bacterium]